MRSRAHQRFAHTGSFVAPGHGEDLFGCAHPVVVGVAGRWHDVKHLICAAALEQQDRRRRPNLDTPLGAQRHNGQIGPSQIGSLPDDTKDL